MNDSEFESALMRFRTRLTDALGPVKDEERSIGSFGNQVVRLRTAQAIFEVVLDRGSFIVNVQPLDSSGERYSLDFLARLLSPAGKRTEVDHEKEALQAIVDWIARARGSGYYSCYLKAYEAFERCLNFASIGEIT